MKSKKMYVLKVRADNNSIWRITDIGIKTDILGTANNWLKLGYEIMIVPTEGE